MICDGIFCFSIGILVAELGYEKKWPVWKAFLLSFGIITIANILQCIYDHP